MKEKIRALIKKEGLDALLIARADSFLGEHYPPESDTLYRATGFSGSAGTALITKDDAVLFVDSRYTEQARIETDFTVFEVPTQTTPSDWIQKHLPDKTIGYNPWQRSVSWVNYMEGKGINLSPVGWQVWQSLFPIRKMKPVKAFDYDLSFCGASTASKIKKVVSVLHKHHLDAYIFTVPESVSYLLNKRSLWVAEDPVIFQRLIVSADGSYRELPDDSSYWSGQKIGMDLDETPMGLFRKVRATATVVNLPDPVADMKAVKNKTEQENIREACLFESTVICRFLAWVEKNKKRIDEMACDAKLKELRAESPLYRGDSFDTIAAVGAHAALAHYRADDKSNVPVTSAPLLLVDTGGNYLNGTTDMTRTIAVGKPTRLMKKRYTQVLKGHIALAMTPVKNGDLPKRLDQNARQFLQADGVNYGHSTGHGIGMYLAVHESPPFIYELSKTPLCAGMLFSNEPGFYDISAGFGIRLENMILTTEGEKGKLVLENLLWIPFDGRLVDFKQLTEAEKAWLCAYHTEIKNRVFPHLSQKERDCLQPFLDFFC